MAWKLIGTMVIAAGYIAKELALSQTPYLPNALQTGLFLLENGFDMCCGSVRSYFLGKVRNISTVCHLLSLPLAW